jgi:hypothetical protein
MDAGLDLPPESSNAPAPRPGRFSVGAVGAGNDGPGRGSGQLAQPFEEEIEMGSYWLTLLISKEPTPAMHAFPQWIAAVCLERV